MRTRRQFRPSEGSDRLERRTLPAGSLPSYLSAVAIGASGKPSSFKANAVATDALGDSFVVGSFRGAASFDPGNSSTTITSASTQDGYVAKYGPRGNLIWVHTLAGRSTTSGGTTTYAVSQGSAVGLDPAGNVLVAGSFQGSVNFGSAAGPSVLSSRDNASTFVARFDPSGNLSWVSQAQASGGDNSAVGLAVDAAGGAVVTGSYASAASFGPTSMVASGASEMFVAHADSFGRFTWATSTSGNAGANAQGFGVAVDGAGNVVVAGSYSGTESFGAASFTSSGSTDAVAWKLDASGRAIWARSFGSTDFDAAGGVAVDSANNVYAVGTFSGTVNFATSTGGSDILTAGPVFDAFVVKLAPTGAEAWARGFVGQGWAKGQGVAVDGAGQVHVAGAFSGTVDFDPGPSTFNRSSVGSADAFVAAVDPSGQLVYSRQAGLTNFNAALGVAVNPAGAVAIVGTQTGSIAFDSANVAAVGQATAFVARLQALPTPATSSPALLASSLTGTNNTTSVTSPGFSVDSADPVDVVTLYRDGQAVATRTGPGTLVDPGPVPQGAHAYAASQTSLAGIIGALSPPTTVTILTTPPAAPGVPVLLAADDSGKVGDGLTNVSSPRFTVSAPSGLTARLVGPSGATLGSSTAWANGSYTVAIAPSLADGTYAIRALLVDAANNVGPVGGSATLTILARIPAAPGLSLVDDSGVIGDNMTSVRRPTFKGSAALGARVDWIAADGSVVASTTASTADGSFGFQAPSAYPNGKATIRARQVDAAGNVSPVAALTITIRASIDDYFGDSSTDVAVFRPNNQTFYVYKASTDSLYAKSFAASGDVPISGDFANSGRGDVAVFRPGTATFFTFNIATGAVGSMQFGVKGDIPVPADYDGDGKADVAVFRPSNQTFYVQMSGSGTVYVKSWAASGDIPVPADYLGTGHADLAVFRPSNQTFYVFDPATGKVVVQAWGASGDVPVPADYDGDGKVDLAVFRPSNQTFYALRSSDGSALVMPWGASGDVPIPGDFFGVGRSSLAVFRPSNQTFYAIDPSTRSVLVKAWGATGDVPIQPPLATYFSFGGSSSNTNGIAIGGGGNGGSARTNAVVVATPPATPAPVDFAPLDLALDASTIVAARRKAAVDRAIAELTPPRPIVALR